MYLQYNFAHTVENITKKLSNIHIEARRFVKLKEKKSDVPKSETFLYFTKITSAAWSINKIIPNITNETIFKRKQKATPFFKNGKS